MQRLPSEQIQTFLDFMGECKTEYAQNVTEVHKQDRQQQDHLHDLEFADNYKERCRLATKIHEERLVRRAHKDRVELVEKVAEFLADKQNKQFMDRLAALVKKQRQVEEYLNSERHYNRRGGGSDADS